MLLGVAGATRHIPDLFGGQQNDAGRAGRPAVAEDVVIAGILGRPADGLTEGCCPMRLVDDAEFGVRVAEDAQVVGVESEGERRRDETVSLTVVLEPLEVLLSEGQGETHAELYAADLDAECSAVVHFAFLSLRLSCLISVETLGVAI